MRLRYCCTSCLAAFLLVLSTRKMEQWGSLSTEYSVWYPTFPQGEAGGLIKEKQKRFVTGSKSTKPDCFVLVLLNHQLIMCKLRGTSNQSMDVFYMLYLLSSQEIIFISNTCVIVKRASSPFTLSMTFAGPISASNISNCYPYY